MTLEAIDLTGTGRGTSSSGSGTEGEAAVSGRTPFRGDGARGTGASVTGRRAGSTVGSAPGVGTVVAGQGGAGGDFLPPSLSSPAQPDKVKR